MNPALQKDKSQSKDPIIGFLEEEENLGLL
jgi:hypothetical protein